MSRGYRYVIVAAIGWVALTGADQANKQPKSGHANKQAEVARTADTTPTPTATPTYAPYPERYANSCYTAANHDTADLCAQWRAAIAAEKAATEARRATNLAIVASVLSFASLCGIIWSLMQTEGALGEARRGNRIAMKANARATRQAVASATDTKAAIAIAAQNAEAARRLTEVSEDTAKRQLRAYLAACNVRIENFGVELQPKFFCTVKNNGATTAFDVQYVGGVFAGRRDNPPPIRFAGSFALRRDMAPGEEWPIEYFIDVPINADGVSNVEANISVLIYAGVIRYRDAFGRRRYTTFKRRVHPYYLKEGAGYLLVDLRGNRSN